MTCESSNLVFAVICSTCNKEYIGATVEGETRVRDQARDYRQHIYQQQYQQLKCREHFRTCRKEEFKIFPFFKLHSSNKYVREQYEKYFRDKFKPQVNSTSSNFWLKMMSI